VAVLVRHGLECGSQQQLEQAQQVLQSMQLTPSEWHSGRC
jgi:hypothetical protein